MSEEKVADSINIQRAVSIEFIKNSGGFAVRVVAKDKKADKGWDPRNNTKQKSDLLLESLASSEYNIGLHFFGPLVDVDIDNDSPFFMRAMDTFLPSCAHVWGRKSKPRSHRAYLIKGADGFDPAEHSVLIRIKKIKEAAVELRGGPQTRGNYSVMPGSIHPSGEMYTWSDLGRARSSLSVTTVATLMRAVRLSGAIAVLAPLWGDGMRNELGMALAGFLHRSWTIGSSMSDEAFVLPYEEAVHFYEVLMDLAGDDPADRHSRLLSFQQTWDKAEKGVPVTGASRIAELTGDSEVVAKLYTFLCDSPDVSAIEEFTARFVIWQGPGLVIDLDQIDKGNPRPFMTRKQFTDSFGHRFVQFVDKKKLIADILFSLKSTGRVVGITFQPGQPRMCDERRGKMINEWSGFEIPPWPDPVDESEIQPFLSYLYEVIASEDRERFNWVLGWAANIFREPANKLGTALVLVGVPGVGKSFLGHQFLNPIIGSRHSATTNDVASITRDFNIAFDNKIFIQGDEATNNQQKATAARLRSLITDKTHMVEPKGVDPYEKPNHARFLFTSNEEENAIFLQGGLDDRRFTVLPVSRKYKGELKGYWHPLVAWASDTDNLSKVHRYLKDHEYNRPFLSVPLVTEAKIIMTQRSWDPFDSWLAAMVARGHPLDEATHESWTDAPSNNANSRNIDRTEWPRYINMRALTRDFQSHIRQHNRQRGTDVLNEHQMGHALTKRGLKSDAPPRMIRTPPVWDEKKNARVEKRVRLYAMPSDKDLRRYIFEKYGMQVEELALEDETAPKAQDNGEF